MKAFPTTLALAVILLAARTGSTVAANSDGLDRIVALVRAVVSNANFPQGQFPDSAVDGSLAQIKEFQELRDLLPTLKSHPRTWWAGVAHTPDELTVFLHALEGISADAYIEVGHAALADLPADINGRSVFEIGFFMPSTRKQWVFTSNYRSPKVRALLNEYKKQFDGDRNTSNWITDVLSGKLAVRDAILREESEFLRQQPIDRPSDLPPDARFEFIRWSLMAALFVAAIALACMVLKNRKSSASKRHVSEP
ncbi:MAG: hypothetical protein ACKVY0_16835 [Prosthecobacter sp.]|uniref:hypothetical protein n=1 Tax=Prosthecobacter sp. TaxID=1965333 RepID=UPI003903A097